jgi:hypothetical protein
MPIFRSKENVCTKNSGIRQLMYFYSDYCPQFDRPLVSPSRLTILTRVRSTRGHAHRLGLAFDEQATLADIDMSKYFEK